MKMLNAEKCKDGYNVRIIFTYHLHSKSEVEQLAKQEGLEVKKEFSTEKRIYAG